MLNRSESSARQRMALLGIKVPKELTDKFRKQSQYKIGRVPENKGKKMSPEVYAKVSKTMFKKGNLPHNTAEKDGVIAVRHDHQDRYNKPYKYIRISLGNWQPYHLYRWQKFRGKVPKGHCLWFIDGDTMNCKLSNLELITRSENMARNTIHRFPKELKEVIKLNNKIKRKIHEKLNN